MKRIANNIPVASILYTMQPDAKVIILDIDPNIISTGAAELKTTHLGLTYTVDEILHKTNLTRIAHATVHRTAINDGLLLLVIDTTHESY